MADIAEKPVAIIAPNIVATSATLSKLGISDSSTMATAARVMLATVAYMPTLMWCFIAVSWLFVNIFSFHNYRSHTPLDDVVEVVVVDAETSKHLRYLVALDRGRIGVTLSEL